MYRSTASTSFRDYRTPVLLRWALEEAGLPVLDACVMRCEAQCAFQKALRDQMADYARNTPAAA